MDIVGAALLIPILQSDTLRIYLKPDNNTLSLITRLPWCFPPPNYNVEMIVYIKPRRCIGREIVLVSQLEPARIVLPAAINGNETGGRRKIIDNPFHHVPVFDKLATPFHPLAIDLSRTQGAARHVLSHHQLKVRSHDAIATEDLAEVQRDAVSRPECRIAVSLAGGRANEGKIEVGILQLSVVGKHLVH